MSQNSVGAVGGNFKCLRVLGYHKNKWPPVTGKEEKQKADIDFYDLPREYF